MEQQILKNLADIQTGPFGSQLHKKDYVENGTPIVTVEHLGERIFTEQNLPKVSETDKKRLSKYILCTGDIVFSRVGSVDRCSFVDKTHNGWMFSGRCLRVRPYKNIDSLYLYYFFCLKETKQFIRNIAVGATMPSINTKLLGEVEIIYPDISVQRKITKILSAIDSKIELNKNINDNLYQQLDTIYRATYPYLPSDELPAGWNCVPLGTLCDSISIKHSFDKEKLVFLNTGDVENGHFLHSTYSLVQEMPGQAKKSIKTNDILYSEIRPINRHFAFVNFQADDYVVSTKLMVIRSREMESRRLYHFLTTQDVINELQIEAESRSGTFPQIRFENIQRLPIIIAPPDIELQFTQILKDYYNMIDSNICENQHLATLRDSILPKLMSGEIDVSELDI